MSTLIQRLQSVAGNVGTQFQTTTNRVLPPKQREEKLQEMRIFSQRNPKLAVRTLHIDNHSKVHRADT